MNEQQVRDRITTAARGIDCSPVPISAIRTAGRTIARRRTRARAAGSSLAILGIAAGAPVAVSQFDDDAPVAQAPNQDQTCPVGYSQVISGETQGQDIVAVSADCTTTPVLDTRANESQPTLQSDGSHLAYVFQDGGHPQLRVLDLESGESTTVATTDGTLGGPAWSPDGRSIAYWDDRNSGHPAIFVVPVEGGSPTQITEPPTADSHPTWSPDGRIAFLRADPEGTRLFVAVPGVPGQGKLTELSQAPADLGHPAWSPDGRQIAAAANGSAVLLNAETGAMETRIWNGADSAGPAGGDVVQLAWDREDLIAVISRDAPNEVTLIRLRPTAEGLDAIASIDAAIGIPGALE